VKGAGSFAVRRSAFVVLGSAFAVLMWAATASAQAPDGAAVY
jgi:hypothetical protein